MIASHPDSEDKDPNPCTTYLCHLSWKTDCAAPTEYITYDPLEMPEQVKKPAGETKIERDQKTNSNCEREKADSKSGVIHCTPRFFNQME